MKKRSPGAFKGIPRVTPEANNNLTSPLLLPGPAPDFQLLINKKYLFRSLYIFMFINKKFYMYMVGNIIILLLSNVVQH